MINLATYSLIDNKRRAVSLRQLSFLYVLTSGSYFRLGDAISVNYITVAVRCSMLPLSVAVIIYRPNINNNYDDHNYIIYFIELP